jgi:hypothetical protein
MLVSPDGLAPVAKGSLAVRGRSFVPLHSTVITGAGRTRLNFSGSLSIHNTSARHVLVIDAIEYRDAAGQLLQSYVPQAIGLRPFASIQVGIAQEDTRGGVGPSFVVDGHCPSHRRTGDRSGDDRQPRHSGLQLRVAGPAPRQTLISALRPSAARFRNEKNPPPARADGGRVA